MHDRECEGELSLVICKERTIDSLPSAQQGIQYKNIFL